MKTKAIEKKVAESIRDKGLTHLADAVEKDDVKTLFTQQDIELVEKQCVHQKATKPYDYIAFGMCYAKAKELVVTGNCRISKGILSLIDEMALVLDNRNIGYRRVPVRFANGGSGIPHTNIERAMCSWSEFYQTINEKDDVNKAYKEFEAIHPYVDGNGRIGHLIWAMAMTCVTGDWPMELPPNFWTD